MLLTKKSSGTARAGASAMVHHLGRGLANALPTMDRRGFLRRSGLGVGVGLAATQLTLVKKADAAGAAKSIDGSGTVEVKRTVCTHCSVGCASGACACGLTGSQTGCPPAARLARPGMCATT